MHTVITGGAGFIGSHLTDYLLADGDEVTILDDFSTGSLDNLTQAIEHERFHLIRGSVLNAGLVNRLVGTADRVFHLAAAVGVRRIIEEPLESLRVNLHGTENVLEAALKADAMMVLMSTSEVYGLNTSDALDENAERIYGSPLVSRWSYAEAKALDEAFAHAYHREYGLRVAIVRLFNTVGERQTGRYGMVVPNLVGQALRGKDLTVFGDGKQTRCFSYVNDIVPSLVTLSMTPEAYGDAVNMGGAQEISIMTLAQRIRTLTNSMSDIELVPYEVAYGEGYADMRRRVPDNTKATKLLGFEPVTGIDEIIHRVATDLKERASVSA
jgi:UDP-glucose 4-epimerase